MKDEDYVLTCEGFYCRQCNNSDDCKDCFGGPGTEDTCSTCEGNSCYNGYCIDLVKKLSEVITHSGTIKEVLVLVLGSIIRFAISYSSNRMGICQLHSSSTFVG